MEHRNIDDIKQELFSHPDYVRSSIWTKELSVQEITNYLLSNSNIVDDEERLRVKHLNRHGNFIPALLIYQNGFCNLRSNNQSFFRSIKLYFFVRYV